MTLDASLRSAGHAALSLLGRSMTLVKVSHITDELAGVVTETGTKYVVQGAMASSVGLTTRFPQVDWNGTAVGDVIKVAYLSAQDMRAHGVRPAQTDRILIGGSSWEVTALADYEPGASTVLYRCLVTRLSVADTADEGDAVVATSSGLVYTQSSTGLAVGSMVVDSAGVWIKAQANGTDPTDRSGLSNGIVVAIPSSTQVVVVSESAVVTASLGLAEGTTFWLSQATAGDVVTTRPNTGWVQELGKVLPGSRTLWFPREGFFL